MMLFRDSCGRIVHANTEALHVSGYSLQQLAELPPWHTSSNEHDASIGGIARVAFISGTTLTRDICCRRPASGRYIWFRATATPLWDVGVLSVLIEIPPAKWGV